MAAETSGPRMARGSVIRVKLINFLTYDEVEVRPAPGLNLLLGPNGTGKSTMVCALCLGLAGDPKILGRSSNIHDYVKHGKDKATTEIELCSGGEKEKNPVIKSVIFTRGSPEYYINERKTPKEKVREFVQQYHIQLDNLCQFLAQDRVVEFARQSKQELLLNTEKAAGNVDLFDQHMKLKDSYADGKELRRQLAAIGEKRTLIEQKLATLEKPFKQVVEYEKRRTKLELMEKKRPWLEYELLKREADDLKSHLDRVKREYAQREALLKPLSDQIANAKSQTRHAERDVETQKRRLDSAKRRIMDHLDSMNRVVDETDAINADLKRVRDDHANKNKRIQVLEASIGDLQLQLEQLNDQDDVQPLMNEKDRELNETNRTLDDLDMRNRELERNLNNEQAKAAALTQQLSGLQNRQQQQLQAVRRLDNQAYMAYNWYLNNKQQFRGAVWLPAVDITIPDRGNIKYVESCIPKRDLFGFVFESFDELQYFLKETTRQNIRVGAGSVPEENMATRTKLPDDLKRLGFRDFVSNMFEAPEGLKKYLIKLCGLNRTPVGTEDIERNLERVNNAIQGRYSKYLTPNKMLTMSVSRYGGGATTLNRAMNDPYFLPQTVGNNEESQENDLKMQLDHANKVVQGLQAQCQQLEEHMRETRRRRETLQQEKNRLRQKAGQRTTLIGQISLKTQHLQQAQRELPDVPREEQRCDERLKAKIEEKVALVDQLDDCTENVECLCRELANSSVLRATFVASAASMQRELNTATDSLRERKVQLDKLKADYSEKSESEKLILERACRGIGLPRDGRQPIPDVIKEEFDKFPNDLEQLDEQMEEEKAMLEQTHGVDRNIGVEYRALQEDRNRTTMQETQLQHAVNEWENNAGVKREKWIGELQQLIETISRNFSRFMSVLGCAGEVELDTPEDENAFIAYGVRIKVKFRDNEPLRELDQQHQSGGERSVSTMLYMLALQELSHVPFRCVDEINQGMDPVNERKVFEMMTKLLGGTDGVLNCTQYFMLTPKLLRGLPMGENIEVWLIHNGPRMLRSKEWSVKTFLKRKQALNAAIA